MSPTVFRYKQFRFFFFSREENRKHIHVYCSEGEAKVWIEPKVELARNYKLSSQQINEIIRIVNENRSEIENAWNRQFEN
ncbi:MAG: DUF4160 domain-containing protein [Melioribacteraceae bacterium]|nr:DUF4160 domain-containing protein [Melioribacteraceae bacterium]MCF8265585.1 DUF4160 domain-containing protein [Melioribacteraceae bacterium]MCF8431528.1 DUF4160 domain-containing protein [Melioribacteraceae bacterium]